MFTLSTTFLDGTSREKQFTYASQACDALIAAHAHWTKEGKPCTISILDSRGCLVYQTEVEIPQLDLF
jgi:hypothetical protein